MVGDNQAGGIKNSLSQKALELNVFVFVFLQGLLKNVVIIIIMVPKKARSSHENR